MAADHIDFLKIALGSSSLFPSKLMREKIALAKEYNIEEYPGGPLCEIAVFQKCTKEFFHRAREMGFTYVEVSEGNIDLTPEERKKYITMAREEGFGVLAEIGKMFPTVMIDPARAVDQFFADLAHGAYKVIIEGRDSGQGVGIYDERGYFIVSLLHALVSGVREH